MLTKKSFQIWILTGRILAERSSINNDIPSCAASILAFLSVAGKMLKICWFKYFFEFQCCNFLLLYYIFVQPALTKAIAWSLLALPYTKYNDELKENRIIIIAFSFIEMRY